MSTVYAIRNDDLKYMELNLTTMDIVNAAPKDISMASILEFHRMNTQMQSWWRPPETDFVEIEGAASSRIPNVSLWTGGSGSSLVLSPKAYRYLGELLSGSGEFLPVLVSGETFYIFNCLAWGEVDDKNTAYDYFDGVEFGLKCLVFTNAVEDMVVFKSAVDGCTTLFCGDRFKSAIENFGLDGVVFDTNLVERFE